MWVADHLAIKQETPNSNPQHQTNNTTWLPSETDFTFFHPSRCVGSYNKSLFCILKMLRYFKIFLKHLSPSVNSLGQLAGKVAPFDHSNTLSDATSYLLECVQTPSRSRSFPSPPLSCFSTVGVENRSAQKGYHGPLTTSRRLYLLCYSYLFRVRTLCSPMQSSLYLNYLLDGSILLSRMAGLSYSELIIRNWHKRTLLQQGIKEGTTNEAIKSYWKHRKWKGTASLLELAQR